MIGMFPFVYVYPVSIFGETISHTIKIMTYIYLLNLD